jgi:lysozyme
VKTSQRGIDLIKEFEGFSAAPYLCPAGVWTIGYGSTRYPDHSRVQPTDKPVTESEAVAILAATLTDYETGVLNLVEVDMTQNQFDALVSFAYNLGLQNLKTSTLLRFMNNGQYAHVAEQFARWNKAAGKVLPGLVRRRAAERDLFLA